MKGKLLHRMCNILQLFAEGEVNIVEQSSRGLFNNAN